MKYKDLKIFPLFTVERQIQRKERQGEGRVRVERCSSGFLRIKSTAIVRRFCSLKLKTMVNICCLMLFHQLPYKSAAVVIYPVPAFFPRPLLSLFDPFAAPSRPLTALNFPRPLDIFYGHF
jgi:hypothetical protein